MPPGQLKDTPDLTSQKPIFSKQPTDARIVADTGFATSLSLLPSLPLFSIQEDAEAVDNTASSRVPRLAFPPHVPEAHATIEHRRLNLNRASAHLLSSHASHFTLAPSICLRRFQCATHDCSNAHHNLFASILDASCSSTAAADLGPFSERQITDLCGSQADLSATRMRVLCMQRKKRSSVQYQFPKTPLSTSECQTRAAVALSAMRAERGYTLSPVAQLKDISSHVILRPNDYFQRLAMLEYYPSYSNVVSFSQDP